MYSGVLHYDILSRRIFGYNDIANKMEKNKIVITRENLLRKKLQIFEMTFPVSCHLVVK